MLQIPNLSSKTKIILAVVVIVLAGSGVGYVLSTRLNPQVAGGTASLEEVKTDKEVGLKDEKTFPDSAQGILEKGGLSGEGTHKLVLDSNPKNAAYLVSSVVDLDEFVGKHIEVRGQTMDANKAAWLMDVGFVKLLE
jgi:hypothetical protein